MGGGRARGLAEDRRAERGGRGGHRPLVEEAGERVAAEDARAARRTQLLERHGAPSAPHICGWMVAMIGKSLIEGSKRVVDGWRLL